MFALLDDFELKGRTWIDAGCGTGALSRLLAERGCAVTGVDASDEMLAVAGRSTSASSASGSLVFQRIESIEQLPSANQSCDGLLCASVLEYTPAPETCLAEFARVIHPDGLLLLSVPNQQSLVRKSFKMIHGLSAFLLPTPAFRYLKHSIFEFSLASITDALDKAGFATVRHNYAGSPLAAPLDGSHKIGTLINVLARRRPISAGTTNS
jgi:2-polyprenyl-3-methyl-5-hydroxy-6-metoxy-1,4-benzoquinol methylase